MAEETQYTAKTGLVTINTANSNLDGTGTLGTVLTGGANGTLIKTVTVKAAESTGQGMIRLFIEDDGSRIRLLTEIPVPAISLNGITTSFESTIDLNFVLKAGYILKASTTRAENFNIIAECLDFTYYTSRARMDTTKYTANTASGIIDTADPNLFGTGSVQIFSAGASPTFKGSSISSITVKAIQGVTPGMVRLFLYNGTHFLFKEIPVPTIVPSPTDQAFEKTIEFENDFDLQAGYQIYASPENNEIFHVIVEGNDWNYYS